MSRGQEGQVVSTAQQQNEQFNQNAQTSYNQAQSDVNEYQDQLAKFAAANPYNAGGEFQTTENKVTANTADAAAAAAAQQMQGQAVRTGQNAAPAIAASEATEQANERNLSGQQAQENATRIGSEAGYNQQVLGATQVPESMEAALSGQQASAGNTALSTQEKAAETPSFTDILGDSFAKGFGSAVGSWAGGEIPGKCWIAARLWGGWGDPRTALVRLWITFQFSRRPVGRILSRLYLRYGERIAEGWMPRSKVVTAVFRLVFSAGLDQAADWLATRAGAARWAEYLRAARSFRGESDQEVSDLVLGAMLAGERAAEAAGAWGGKISEGVS